ncbi:hypothetical protein GJAV_G00034730 [Gymnothorax javanicus]|nr:hypothetical protein GJAV_G00034730 [Gymnothorax javanicus]
MHNIKRTPRAFSKNSMGLWRSTQEANSTPFAQVTIKCGIYQGNALSPLLFCIGLNPLNQIITKSGYGYQFRSGATISHLLHMDDIKLNARNERNINSLIHITWLYSNAIGLSFGMDKCGRMVARSGFVVMSLLASQSAVLARVIEEPTDLKLGDTKFSATQDSCKDCTQILELFMNMVYDADAQGLIQNSLDGLCARLPGDEARTACLSKWRQYQPIAIHLLVKFMKPAEVCAILGLCDRLSEGKNEALSANHIDDGDMASGVPVRGTQPVVHVSPQCTFCMYVVKKLESMLPKERTEATVLKLLDEVCYILPKSYEKQCEEFVEKYGKELVEYLLSSAAPHTICVLLHLCLFQEPTAVEMPALSECDSCQTVTVLSHLHLGSNITEHGVSAFLESFCRMHPHAIPECEIFTQRFGSELQRILGKQGDVLEMCQKEDICAAGNEFNVLGGDHCTWGRDYICRNMKTAQECESVPFCQKYVWN